MAASDDRPVPERTGVLVLRVWLEQDPPGRLRARLLEAAEPGQAPTTLATEAGLPGIRDAVESWLRRFLDAPER